MPIFYDLAVRPGNRCLLSKRRRRTETGLFPKPQRHEHAVRIIAVPSERLALHEPDAAVERLGRLECGCRARLEPEKFIGTLAGDFDDVGEDRPSGTPATIRYRRAHGFDLTLLRVEFHERATSEQQWPLPRRPECNVGMTELVEVQCVYAFRGRQSVHALQMFIQ